MVKQSITWEQLLNLVQEGSTDITHCDPIYQKYLSWQALDSKDELMLDYVGDLVAKTPSSSPAFMEDYWKEDSLMELWKYPYIGCQVFKLRACTSCYFVYTEWGGHVPEKRVRLIQKNLIRINSQAKPLGA